MAPRRCRTAITRFNGKVAVGNTTDVKNGKSYLAKASEMCRIAAPASLLTGEMQSCG